LFSWLSFFYFPELFAVFLSFIHLIRQDLSLNVTVIQYRNRSKTATWMFLPVNVVFAPGKKRKKFRGICFAGEQVNIPVSPF